MRRKRQTLVDVVRNMMERYQEAVLDDIKHYPEHKAWHLDRTLKDYTRRMTEAVLEHIRTVQADERAELERELFEEDD